MKSRQFDASFSCRHSRSLALACRRQHHRAAAPENVPAFAPRLASPSITRSGTGPAGKPPQQRRKGPIECA
jgi:hypothetical protein